MYKHVFGPVPSRRLGKSLGINNIPLKHCSYSCIYCQVGRTLHLEIKRKEFYSWRDIVDNVIKAVDKIGEKNLDYITFVPDGEPTLDISLGKEILEIKKNVSIHVAVLTNGSLLFHEDVRNDLSEADIVSIKVDAVTEDVFKKINRPHPDLNLIDILEGMIDFSKYYRGKLLSETMLVRKVNDSREEISKIARFIAELKPSRAYIAIPIRPPAESWVKPANEQAILMAYQSFLKQLPGKVELLVGYETPYFEGTRKNPIEDLLAIVSVHPMRIDYAYKFLTKKGLDPEETIKNLIKNGKIVKIRYLNREFIMRKISLQALNQNRRASS